MLPRRKTAMPSGSRVGWRQDKGQSRKRVAGTARRCLSKKRDIKRKLGTNTPRTLCMTMILPTPNLLTEQQKPRRAEILRMGRTIVCNSQCAVHLVLSLTRACMSELTNLFSAPRTRLRSTRSNGLGRHCKTLKPHRQPDAETSFHSSTGTKCAGMQAEMSCSSDNKSQLPPSHQSP